MGSAYTPGLTVTPRTVLRKARRLPLAGQVVVKVGDTVKADQVVARTDLPGRVFPLNLANKLSLLPDEVAGAMRKPTGAAVTKDEVIAVASSFFGLFHNEFHSPIAGTIESVSSVTGQVILRDKPIPVEVTAYVAGTIVEEIASEGVVVETVGAFVQGIFGLAGEVHAPIAVLASSPEQVVAKEQITAEHKGKILVGGARLTLGALRRCAEVGVAGVVCGGFAYQDITAVLGHDLGVAITGGERIGTTLVLTEGFGDIAMAKTTYDLLVSHEGAFASMNGATQIRASVIRPEIVVPLDQNHASKEKNTASELGFEVGAAVRCIRAPYFGRLGNVSELPVALMTMPSETKVRVVTVQLAQGELITLPRANVEVIQRQWVR